MPLSIGTPWITHKSSFAWPKRDNGSVSEHSWSWHPTGLRDVSHMLTTRTSNGQPGWNVARLKRFLPVLGGSRNRKAFGGHCVKGWAEEGDQGKGLSSQSNKGPLAKWWCPDRLLVIRSRWKDLFMDSFQVVFLQAVQSRLTFPVTNKVLSHPGWYQIILGEHPHAGTVAWDKGCYQKLLLSDQSLFLLCSLRRLCYVVNTGTDHTFLSPVARSILVSFLLLNPLGAWPHLWDWVSFLRACPDICFRHRRLDLTHHFCLELLNLNSPNLCPPISSRLVVLLEDSWWQTKGQHPSRGGWDLGVVENFRPTQYDSCFCLFICWNGVWHAED